MVPEPPELTVGAGVVVEPDTTAGVAVMAGPSASNRTRQSTRATGQGVTSMTKMPDALHWIVNVPLLGDWSEVRLMSATALLPARASA